LHAIRELRPHPLSAIVFQNLLAVDDLKVVFIV
jgi:hypothetical protein